MKKVRKTALIKNRVSIHDRPIEADGKRFGDWEMDLIIGKGQHSTIVTLCERCTNNLLMKRLPNGKKSIDFAKIVVDMLLPFTGDALKTITTDNGVEFRHHEYMTRFLGAQVYFADSYSSWQKGSIESTNKLIRQYIPKGSDFNDYSDKLIEYIQNKINRRPREKLGFETPVKVFYTKIAFGS